MMRLHESNGSHVLEGWELLTINSPEKCSCEHVHNEWMMLMTRPCVEARKDNGPVDTNKVTMWNKNGKWLATEMKLLKLVLENNLYKIFFLKSTSKQFKHKLNQYK